MIFRRNPNRLKKCCQYHVNAAAELWLEIGYVQEYALRREIAEDIENAVIEIAGNSAATMRQAARIARGVDEE